MRRGKMKKMLEDRVKAEPCSSFGGRFVHVVAHAAYLTLGVAV